MWTSVHTATALLLLNLPLPWFITVPTAFQSHDVMDRLGEADSRTIRKTELLSLWAGTSMGLLTGTLPLYIGATALGSGMDILDKWIGPALGQQPNTLFPCHRPGFTEIGFTENQTIFAGIVATGLTIFILGGEAK